MSRSDFPPGYDESRLLSNPQPGGGYPASAPPYGFSAYGGQPPYPQPNDPYRGQPNDPYRGQPNDPYRGYPPPSLPVMPVIPTGVGKLCYFYVFSKSSPFIGFYSHCVDAPETFKNNIICSPGQLTLLQS